MYGPLVSIIMPVYNREDYVCLSVQSIIAQKYLNKEIIIINDCSTDNSYNLIKNYVKDFDNIKVIKLNKNIGQSEVRNYGLKLVSKNSKYVLYHDSDDVSVDCNKIHKLVEFLELNENYYGVGCLGEYIDDYGKRMELRPSLKLEYEDIVNDFHKTNHFLVGNVLMRTQDLKKLNEEETVFFSNKKTLYEDYRLFSRLFMKGYKLKNLNFVGLYVRRHNGRISNTKKDSYAINNLKEIQGNHLKYLNSLKSNINIKKLNIGLIVIATNKYSTFVNNLLKSANKFFMTDHNIKFFVFSDKSFKFEKNINDKTKVINIKHEDFPGPTLYRYKYIFNNKNEFNKMDYIYYLDADMLFKSSVGNEILGNLVTVNHPGYFNKKRIEFPYENNKKSTAYIDSNKGEKYYFGCFQGGKTEVFLKMCSRLEKRIDTDLENSIIARWWDESHLNWYCIYEQTPDIVLNPSYAYPEGWDFLSKDGFKPIIINVKKDAKYLRDNKSESEFINNFNILKQKSKKIQIVKEFDNSILLPQSNNIEYINFNKEKYMTRKKYRLDDVSFIIPAKIDSKERLRNLNSLISFLGIHFSTNIFVGECDTNCKLKLFNTKNINYTFFKKENFNKAFILNSLYKHITTKYISIINTDIFLNSEQIIQSIDSLRTDECDIIYPFDGSIYYITNERDMIKLIRHKNIEVIHKDELNIRKNIVSGCVMFKKDVIEKIGYENESINYKLVDNERYERLKRFNFKISKLNNSSLYHLTHPKSKNNNDEFNQSKIIIEKINNMNIIELEQYIKNFKYESV